MNSSLRGKLLVGACLVPFISPGIASAQEAACLYRGVLVTRPVEWCNANGEGTIGFSQLTNPSQRDATRVLQLLLAGAGYEPGPVDGAAGPRTVAALREFQRQNGLPATGEPDPAAINRLFSVAQERTKAWQAANSSSSNPSTSQQMSAAERDAAARYGGKWAVELGENARPLLNALAVVLVAAFLFVLNLFQKRRKSGD